MSRFRPRPDITDEEWEAQQIRDEQGRLTHTPEGEPLKVPLSGGARFRPRVHPEMKAKLAPKS